MTEPFDGVEAGIHDFNRKGIAFIKELVIAFLMLLVRPLATTTEAILRMDFGERYFTSWNVFAGTGLICFASFPVAGYKSSFSRMWFETVQEPWHFIDYLTLIFGTIWLLVFLANSLLHLRRIRERTETACSGIPTVAAAHVYPKSGSRFILLAVGSYCASAIFTARAY